MLTLLVVIFISFVGLGIPDCLFGTAWPAVYREFGLPISYATLVSLLVSGLTMISSLLSARVINRFGTGRVIAVSTVLTVMALWGYSMCRDMLSLCLCAVPLGLGAGAIDTGLNNYVALHYKATHMNFLHCFYGVGVTVSPYLMSLALGDNNNWRQGYRFSLAIQAVIALVTILSLPLWRRAGETAAAEESAPRTLSLRELFAMPRVRMAWLVFIGSCAIESMCSGWGSTFLVNTKGMATDAAARTVTLFFAGMAAARLLSGLAARRLTCWQLIFIGYSVLGTGVLLMLLPLPAPLAGVGFMLAGLGTGPIFPNFTQLTPQNFGRDISQSVIGSQMAATYAGIMVMPALFGQLAQHISTALFPWYVLMLYAVMLTGIVRFCRMKPKE